MAPFTARSRSSASSILTTLDGGAARGYAGIPQVERAIAVHLCPRNTAAWRNRPRLPSKACKLTAALAARQPLQCTPWLSCRFTKPRRSNRCTRVVPTRGWCRSCARRLTSLYVPREGDVHHGGPGAPSLAQPGRDEGRRKGTLLGGAVRRHCRGLCPAVLGGTAADQCDPAHPAPAWCTIHRCPQGQASVCPSPSCILQSCSAPGWIDT